MEKYHAFDNTVEAAATCDYLGRVFVSMKDFAEGLKWYEKSLDIRSNLLPSNHPDFATSYTNIGRWYEQNGNYSRAAAFYKKALYIRERSLPADQFPTSSFADNDAKTGENPIRSTKL